MLCAYDRAVLGGLMRGRDEEMNRGKGAALKLLMQGSITAEQMKGFVEEARSEEHTSELQSLMRISYAVFCLKKKKTKTQTKPTNENTNIIQIKIDHTKE